MANTKSSTQSGGLADELGEELYGGLLTFEQAQAALRVSRYTLMKMIKAGEITAVKIGVSRYIGKGTLTAYINAVHGTTTNGSDPS